MKLVVAALALGCLMSAAVPSVAEDQPSPEQNSVRKQISELQWIRAPNLLQSIKDGTAAANKIRRERGWDEMEVVGWQTSPHYETQTNRLEWAVTGRDLKSNTEVVNFNTRILGRGGVMSVVLIAEPQELSAATDEFKSTLAGFSYSAGQRYAEYRPGDKVAKYGLAALDTGGASAVAGERGLCKVIRGAARGGSTLIAGAFVALFGRLVRRVSS